MAPFVLLALALVAPVERWRAPAQCPGQTWVDDAIAELLLEPTAQPVDWDGVVEATTDGFALTLSVPQGVRVVVEQDCDALARAAALIVAVASDPVAVAIAVEPSPPPLAPTVQPTAAVEKRPRPATLPTRPTSMRPLEPDQLRPIPQQVRPPARLRGVLSVASGTQLGVLPRPGVAFAVAAGVLGERWKAEVVALTSLPRRQFLDEREDREDARTRGARAMTFGGQLRGCGVLGEGVVVRVPLCGALEVGGVWARGFGPGITPRSRVQPWVAAVPSAALDVQLSPRWSFMAVASAPVALLRPGTHIDGVGEVFRVGRVGARVWLGPTLRFP